MVGLIQNRLQLFLRVLIELIQTIAQVSQIVVNGGRVVIKLVGHGLEISVALTAGGVGFVLNGGKGIVDDLGVLDTTAGHGIQRVGEIAEFVQQAAQTVTEGLGGGVAVGEGGAGLKLAHNAAHILSSLDQAGIGTAEDFPRLQPGNAPHVVAQMGVAHHTGVGAVPDGASGQPGDAAHVGGDILIGLGIDRTGIGAGIQGAQVLPGNAAGVGDAGNLGIAGAG